MKHLKKIFIISGYFQKQRGLSLSQLGFIPIHGINWAPCHFLTMVDGDYL